MDNTKILDDFGKDLDDLVNFAISLAEYKADSKKEVMKTLKEFDDIFNEKIVTTDR